MPKGSPNTAEKRINGILKVYDPVAKAYRPSYIAPDATSTVQGDVLLSDAVDSTDDAATGITAATPKAVKEVNDNANTKLSMTETKEQTVSGPVVFNGKTTFKSESTFTEKVTFEDGITIPGGVTLEGDVTGNADTATKLETPININTKSGSQTESTKVSFDGSKDITLPLGDIDAASIKGVLSLDNIPQGAIERVVNYESLDAAFDAYAAADADNKPFQIGDTIRVPDENGDTSEMYAVIADPTVKTNYVKYAASVAAEALEAEHAKVADKINISDIADGSAMFVKDKVLQKSTSTIGDEYTPVYLHDGAYEAISHTIKSDVPENAKFTDTTYTDFTAATKAEDGTITNGVTGLVPAPTTTDAKFLKNDGTWADVPSNWDELDGKPVFYNGTIQGVGIEDGKFYVEALLTCVGGDKFNAQLQIISVAGNSMKLTSAEYAPTDDGTLGHKFVIEPPTGQDITDIKIVSAGVYYNSITLLDEWKPEATQEKYPGAFGHITSVENSIVHTPGQTATVNAVISGNNTQQFSVNLYIKGDSAVYSSDKQSFTTLEEGLSNMSFGVLLSTAHTGGEVYKASLVVWPQEGGAYELDTWYPHSPIYLNTGKIVQVTDKWNDATQYAVDYVINTTYDYTKYHLMATYNTPEGALATAEYVSYDVREKTNNFINGTVYIPKTKTQASGSKTLELVSIELNEMTTGNEVVQDIWEPQTTNGVSSWNDLTDKPMVSIGKIRQIVPSSVDVTGNVYIIPNTNDTYTYRLEFVDDSGHHFLTRNLEGMIGTESVSKNITFTNQEITDASFDLENTSYIKANLYRIAKDEYDTPSEVILLDTTTWYHEDNTCAATIIDVKTRYPGDIGVATGEVKYEIDCTLTTGTQRKYPVYRVNIVTKSNQYISFNLSDEEIHRGETVRYILEKTKTASSSTNKEIDEAVMVTIKTDSWNGETGMEPTLAVWKKDADVSWDALENKPRVCIAVDESSSKWLNESNENEWSLGLNTDLFEIGAPATVHYHADDLNPSVMTFSSLATSMLVSSSKTQLENYIKQAWGTPDSEATNFIHLTLPSGNMSNKVIELKPNNRYVLTNATTLTNGNGSLFAILTDGNYGKTAITTKIGTVQGSLNIYQGVKAEGSKTEKDAVLTTEAVARDKASAGDGGVYIDSTGKMKASMPVIQDYFTANYNCYAITDNRSTGGSIKLETVG